MSTLLYGCETWAIREKDKFRITSAVMKFMRRAAKCTWQDTTKRMKMVYQNLK